MQRLILNGRIYKIAYNPPDPKLGYSTLTFTLPDTQIYKKKDGGKAKMTTWFRVKAISGYADALKDRIYEGIYLTVIGTCKLNTYVAKNGKEMAMIEVRPEDIIIHSSTEKEEDMQKENAIKNAYKDAVASVGNAEEEDLPF